MSHKQAKFIRKTLKGMQFPKENLLIEGRKKKIEWVEKELQEDGTEKAVKRSLEVTGTLRYTQGSYMYSYRRMKRFWK